VPDWYLVLDSGAVHVSRSGEGGAEVLERLGAGDVLDPGVPGVPAAWSATAEEPVRGLLVPQTAVAAHRLPLPSEPVGGYRGDVGLFTRRVRDLLKGPPVGCEAGTPVAEAARLMSGRAVGSLVVRGGAGAALGIVTDRDLRNRVVAAGLSPGAPVERIMSSPLVSIEGDRLAFDALLEMTRRNIHHLGVLDGGRLAGVVSSHDLLGLQGAHPVALAREIEVEPAQEGLEALAGRVEAVVRWLAAGGAGAVDIGRIVAELNDRLVRRLIALVERELEADGVAPPGVAYSWLAAGSEGRREQTLKTDQDNGLVYEDPPSEAAAPAAAYFARLAGQVGQGLERLGFPRCEGGYMASNPQWCQPASAWRQWFDRWMEVPYPDRVLQASVFFDLRPVAGDPAPGAALWAWVTERAPHRVPFLRHMARAAVEHPPPLGLFGQFVVERTGAHRNRLDLKGRGVFPLTQAMRVCALSLGVRETHTLERLAAAGAHGLFTAAEAQELREAYEVICRLRLGHQLARLEAGLPADNFVDPQELGKANRLLLKEAFRTLAWLQRALEERFQTAVIG
jgi:CBS domain-containing protein